MKFRRSEINAPGGAIRGLRRRRGVRGDAHALLRVVVAGRDRCDRRRRALERRGLAVLDDAEEDVLGNGGHAWTDGAQALSVDQFSDLMADLAPLAELCRRPLVPGPVRVAATA